MKIILWSFIGVAMLMAWVLAGKLLLMRDRSKARRVR